MYQLPCKKLWFMDVIQMQGSDPGAEPGMCCCERHDGKRDYHMYD